jgi:TonB family protein
MRAQEQFKGAVLSQPSKKAHTTKRPSVLRVPPKAVEANARGNSSFDDARYEDAVAAYQEALAIYPQYVEAQVNLGDAYRELKRYDEAIAAFKRAIALKPTDGDAFNGLGDTYEAMGRAADAAQARARADANFARANPNFVQGGVMAGKAISKPAPSYPTAARLARISGQVQVKVLVDENGDVIRAEAVSGHPLLQTAAVQAALATKFTPTTLSGRPVKVTGVITYNFVL